MIRVGREHKERISFENSNWDNKIKINKNDDYIQCYLHTRITMYDIVHYQGYVKDINDNKITISEIYLGSNIRKQVLI